VARFVIILLIVIPLCFWLAYKYRKQQLLATGLITLGVALLLLLLGGALGLIGG